MNRERAMSISRRPPTDILRGVSRSFFLSLTLLPRPLRDPISLAYLLARATDTVADTTELAVASRLETLAILSGAIQGNAGRDELSAALSKFSPHQGSEAERTLIESVPLYLDWLDSLAESDRSDVRSVLAKIAHGQTLDLQRFTGIAGIRALKVAAELNEYTYLVAGCVGEFWTRICARHLRRFAPLAEGEMLRLGTEYGQGLQLINILRDLGADLRDGRCYLPSDELSAAGINPDQLAAGDANSAPVLHMWRQRAESGMAAGLAYAKAIRNRRVRIATVLPALIGIRTLALLRNAGTESVSQVVKVPRSEIRRIVATTAITFGGRRTIEQLFRQLSR